MATVKRIPYQRASTGGVAIQGEVRTAGPGDGRPAVLILLGAERNEGAGVRLLERLARAGLTAISAEILPHWSVDTLEEAADAVSRFAGDLLAGRHSGLAAPRGLGIFGEKRQALLAIAVANREPRVASLVTWDPEAFESVQQGRMAALSAEVRARWLEMRSGKKSGQRERGGERREPGAAEVRRLASDAEMMDAAVAWFAAMLS